MGMPLNCNSWTLFRSLCMCFSDWYLFNLGHLFFNFIFIVDTITDVPIHPPPLYTSTQPLCLLSSDYHHTIVCVNGLCIYVFWIIPLPSFIQSSHSPSPLRAVSLFHISMSLVLFRLSVYFVYWVPHKSEILWYLSFSNQHISLSILPSDPSMLSEKVVFSFFLSPFYGYIVSHCVNVSIFFQMYTYLFSLSLYFILSSFVFSYAYWLFSFGGFALCLVGVKHTDLILVN